MNLAEYLSTHLRYTAWASRRTLQALRRLSEEEFNRNLGASFGSIRGTLEHMFVADRVWFEKLAGEPAGLDEPPDDDYYSTFSNLENDYRFLLTRYQLLASLTDDPELALRFAYSQVKVHGSSIPKWQGVMNTVSHATYHRGQIASMLCQLGHAPLETDIIRYYFELEGRPWPYPEP